jgi:predicted nucleic-acid-binding Zn-ribbon protein
MKTFFLWMVAAIMLCGLHSQAAIITVSNAPNSPGQYTNLQEALDAANSGDTIYVSGSMTSYGTIDIDKQITLVGAGFNPNNQYNLKSEIGSVSLKANDDPINPTDASGTTITGFKISGISVSDNNINDIKILRNEITSSITTGSKYCQGWIIKNNIIDRIQTYTYATIYATDFVISNNIINNYIRYFKSNTILIANNIFPDGFSFTGISLATIQNNIFYGGTTSGCNYCTFLNNLSIGADNIFDYNENTANDENLVNVDPLFIDVSSYTFDFAYDYHLQEGSPCIGAGTDEEDMGIYGGMYPFPSGGDVPFQTSPMPSMPQIVNMTILNYVVPADGTLEVEISAKSQE